MNDKPINPARSANPHSEANFNPAEYTVLDYVDNRRPQYHGGPIAAYEAQVKDWEREITRWFPNWRSPQHPDHNIHKCRHCGNGSVRYICVVEHTPTKSTLVFGSECVHRLEFANRNEFKLAQLKSRAELGHARLKVYSKRQQFLAACPELKAIVDSDVISQPSHLSNSFARDILHKLDQYGDLSPRQVECLFESLRRDDERAARKVEEAQKRAELVAAGVKGPEGRCEVTGVVLHTRQTEGPYGTSYKWLIQLDSGVKVWSTIPNAAFDLVGSHELLRQRRVSFVATWERSTKDETFAFGSRPSKFKSIA